MDLLDAMLPDSRRYEIISIEGNSEKFSASIRVDLNCAADVKSWISDFSATTSVGFIFRSSKSNPRKGSNLYIQYKCNLASTNKDRCLAQKSATPDLTERNYGCKAAIKFWITVGDDYALKKLAGNVILNWEHNHEIRSAHYLSLLRPLQSVKNTFFEYFNDGCSVIDAITRHETTFDFLEPSEAAKYRVNKAHNPSKKIVYHWHDEWRERNFGPRLGSYDILMKKSESISNSGIIFRLNADPFAILIVTPLMQRAHKLSSAADICFVDSTAACDAENHSITFMLTSSCIGALPLAIMITSDQTEKSYVAGFTLLKDAMNNSAFACQESPKIFLTDDSLAEKNALASVWPTAERLNCIFHIAQAQWRWLWEAKNKVDKEHRQPMIKDFRSIMFSKSEEEASTAFDQAVANLRA